jgi:Ni/Fe-hydrogenase subunit HybB-like protein
VPFDPVVSPGETPASVTDGIAAITLDRRTPVWWWAAFGLALLMLGGGVLSVGTLFGRGVQAWGNNWPVMWGFDLINYVWWIGIASGGTLVSSLFFLTRSDWRTSVNRIAESITIFAALCAGIFPIIHLGRPWFFYWLAPYPNTMTLWPQFRSPLLWDFIAIATYVFSSIVFWFLGLMPDLAALRDRARSRAAQVAYGVLAMGFRGTGPEWRRYHAAYGVIAGLMAPLVISVHSIVGLDFAAAATPGWYSTQYPPFFVFGAALSGFGMVLLLVMPLRGLLGLHAYITERHMDVLGRLLLTASLAVSYCYMMEVFDIFYSAGLAERRQFLERIGGLYGWVYWLTLLLNCALPLVLSWRWARMQAWLLALVGLGVMVGMWFERFGIIVAVLHRTNLPSAWGDYAPTLVDFGVLAGTLGLFGAGFLLFVRFLPVVSIAEMRQMIATGKVG